MIFLSARMPIYFRTSQLLKIFFSILSEIIMKKILAILVVALLATSISFAGEATGTVTVEVKHPDVTVAVIQSPDANQWLYPQGFIDLQKFVFQATGAWGIQLNTWSAVWGGTDVSKVKATHHSNANLPPAAVGKTYDGPVDDGNNLTNFQADFGIYCYPGVAKGFYNVTCTLTVDY
jgi:hypothetical protein